MGFFETFFGKIVMTFFISMVPVIELRGAIPVATAAGLDLFLAICVSVVGNMVPVPFIILFIRKVFDWMRKVSSRFNGLIEHFENKAEKHRERVNKYKFWGLFLLVAIPLPGTGAWTGALVAAMLEMRLKDAVPAIFLGVVTAGIVVALVTTGVVSFVI